MLTEGKQGMPTAVQALVDERANLGVQMRQMVDDAGGRLSGEDVAKFNALETDYDRLGDDIARARKVDTIAADNRVDRSELRAKVEQAADENPEDPTARPEYVKAFTQFAKYGSADMDPDLRRVLGAGSVNTNTKDVRNALGTGTTAGGYTIPAAFRNTLIEAQLTVNPVRGEVSEITTDTGANLPWPTVDDTSNVGAILAENTGVSQQDVVFGTASLDAYMYTSKLVLCSYQLLQDTGFDLEGWLRGALAKRVGRIQNTHFTTGTGTSQPDGLVTGLAAGNTVTGATGTTLTLGGTTAVAYGNLIDVMDKIDSSYLAGAKWMTNKLGRTLVRKLVDGQSRPLWEPSLTAGQPESILGYPVVLNSAMATPAASAVTFLFGDFRAAYVIRDVRDLFLIRFNERYADALQVGFAMFQRTDGTVQNAAAFAGYKHSAT